MPDSREVKQGQESRGERDRTALIPPFLLFCPSPSPLLYSPPLRSFTPSPPTPPQVAVIEGQLRGLDERAMRARPGEQRNFGMSHINKRYMEVGMGGEGGARPGPDGGCEREKQPAGYLG